MAFRAARAVLLDAIARGVFPAASVDVGTARAVLWRDAVGRLAGNGSALAQADTIFDLASLTKVLATATVAMRLVDRARLDLDDPIGRWFPEWRGNDRDGVTVEDVLSHASGLPAWLPLYREHRGREAYARAIAETPLEYAPRARSVYSDLGFILLGFVAEDMGGEPLDALFGGVRARLGLDDIAFLPPVNWRARTAPTGEDPWRGRGLVGEVHDENAAALGGIAGHAGLFGTAPAVGAFARQMLRAWKGDAEACEQLASQPTVIRFTSRREIPGSSRALGWDTMLPASSCGTRMSSLAFGHTGFAGTSLWIDPVAGIYVVLLTNRAHLSRDSAAITEVRRAFHDAVMQQWGRE
jgi:CubicO group peptidase (beta-lactamase class C family)